MIRTEYGNNGVNHLYPEKISNRYHAEKLQYDLDDDNLNITILGRRIERGSKVLDVACGEGKYAYLYKQKRVSAWGIDMDPESVSCAKSKKIFKDILCCDVEREFNKVLKLRDEIGSNFDCIILSDVLEHFINPTQVLENLYEVLREEGKMLISVPNVGNADIFLNLLEGKFNYAREGILDNTHFHFFTKKSFAEWIKEINEKNDSFTMDCSYLGGTFGITKYLEKIESKYPLIYHCIQCNPQYQTIQLLFELRKVAVVKLTDLYNITEHDDKVIDTIESILEGTTKNNKIVIQDNERKILKNEIKGIREGWENAQKELEEIKQGWKDCNRQLKTKEEELKIAKQGWNKCNEQLKIKEEELVEVKRGWRGCNEQLKIKEEKLAEAKQGWDNCNEQLKIKEKELAGTKQGWKECNEQLKIREKELEEVKRGWKECNKQLEIKEKELEETKKSWKECNKQLITREKEFAGAKQGWKECNERLTTREKELAETKQGWDDCNEQLTENEKELAEAQQGWKECNEQLQIREKELAEAQQGWKECNEQLQIREKELAEVKEGWKECNEQLQIREKELAEAQQGWKECDKLLKMREADIEKLVQNK